MVGMKRLLLACLVAVTWPASGEACGTMAEMVHFGSPLPDEHRELFANPVLRLNVGGSWPPSSALGLQAAFNVSGGALIGWPDARLNISSAWLLPELGYSWRPTVDGRGEHLGRLGMGAGYGRFGSALFLYTPRFVAGAASGTAAVGFQHSLALYTLTTFLSLELSHQVLSLSDQLRHEILLSVGMNILGPLPLFRLLAH